MITVPVLRRTRDLAQFLQTVLRNDATQTLTGNIKESFPGLLDKHTAEERPVSVIRSAHTISTARIKIITTRQIMNILVVRGNAVIPLSSWADRRTDSCPDIAVKVMIRTSVGWAVVKKLRASGYEYAVVLAVQKIMLNRNALDAVSESIIAVPTTTTRRPLHVSTMMKIHYLLKAEIETWS